MYGCNKEKRKKRIRECRITIQVYMRSGKKNAVQGGTRRENYEPKEGNMEWEKGGTRKISERKNERRKLYNEEGGAGTEGAESKIGEVNKRGQFQIQKGKGVCRQEE